MTQSVENYKVEANLQQNNNKKPTATSSGTSQIEDNTNSKNSPCKYFALGNCKYGDDCKFSHDTNKIQELQQQLQEQELEEVTSQQQQIQCSQYYYPSMMPHIQPTMSFGYAPPTPTPPMNGFVTTGNSGMMVQQQQQYPFLNSFAHIPPPFVSKNWIYAPVLLSKYRTKPCKFYSSGTCRFGDACRFMHTLTPTPPQTEDDVEEEQEISEESDGQEQEQQQQEVNESKVYKQQQQQQQQVVIQKKISESPKKSSFEMNQKSEGASYSLSPKPTILETALDLHKEKSSGSSGHHHLLNDENASVSSEDEELSTSSCTLPEVPKYSETQWKRIEELCKKEMEKISNSNQQYSNLESIVTIQPCLSKFKDYLGIAIQIGVNDPSTLTRIPKQIQGIKTISFVASPLLEPQHTNNHNSTIKNIKKSNNNNNTSFNRNIIGSNKNGQKLEKRVEKSVPNFTNQSNSSGQERNPSKSMKYQSTKKSNNSKNKDIFKGKDKGHFHGTNSFTELNVC